MEKNGGISGEIIQKLQEAKKLEKEAFLLFLPENVKGHLEVIEMEVKNMLKECWVDVVFGRNQPEKKEHSQGKVKKVDIR